MALLPFCMHEGMCWPRGFKRREARAVALLVAKKKKKKSNIEFQIVPTTILKTTFILGGRPSKEYGIGVISLNPGREKQKHP